MVTSAAETNSTHAHARDIREPKGKVNCDRRYFRANGNDLHQPVSRSDGESGPAAEIVSRVNSERTATGCVTAISASA